jgi:hypothetical protein
VKKQHLIAAVIVLLTATTAWAGEYTDKSVHDSGDAQTYKHPKQRSFTSPFDYGPVVTPERPAPAAPAPTPTPQGKCNCFTFDGTKSFDPDKQALSYH